MKKDINRLMSEACHSAQKRNVPVVEDSLQVETDILESGLFEGWD